MAILEHYNKKGISIMWITLLLIILAIEIIFRPRLDITVEQELLLWYGRTKRKYIKLL